MMTTNVLTLSLCEKENSLNEKFIVPPFSVLDTRQGYWQDRKRKWLSLGLKGELGRDKELTFKGNVSKFDYYRVKEGKRDNTDEQSTSIFDPVLCEIIYKWFNVESGYVLDPFAGGSVRGIVAHKLGYKYTGIELRQEQVDENRNQSLDILKANNQPNYYCGDSDDVLNGFKSGFDLIFTCPPYMDLEIYSDGKNDLSNMNDKSFIEKYESIIHKSCKLLKSNGFACFVVGEVRDKKTGFYKDFIGITKRAFYNAGLKLYNDIILLNAVASASMRAGKQFESGKKVCKIHQNVLVFKKG